MSGTHVGLAQVAAPRGGEEGPLRWSRSQSSRGGGGGGQGGKDRGTASSMNLGGGR